MYMYLGAPGPATNLFSHQQTSSLTRFLAYFRRIWIKTRFSDFLESCLQLFPKFSLKLSLAGPGEICLHAPMCLLYASTEICFPST